MNYTDKLKLISILRERGAVKPCTICGKEDLVVLDRTTVQVESHVSAFRNMPCALIGCENCGRLYTVSLGLLGLPLEFGAQNEAG